MGNPAASQPTPGVGTARGALPRPGRRGGRLLGIPVWQLVTIEALLAAAAWAAIRWGWPVAAALTVVGLGVALGRHRHRPLPAWLLVKRHYRRRRRSVAGATAGAAAGTSTADPDPRSAPLLELLPGLDISGIALPDGHRLAVCFDGTGWSAVVAVHRERELLVRPDRRPTLPFAVLTRAMQIDDIPLASLQVLVDTIPAPDPTLPPSAPPATSYRYLNDPPIPAIVQTFIVLRVDGITSSSAVEARGGGTDGARRALKRSTARLVHLLAAAGVTARPLAEEPLRTALFELAGTTRSTAGTPPVGGRRTREHKRGWQVDDWTHLSWTIRSWPDVAAPLQVLAGLAGEVTTTSTQLSFTLYPGAPNQVRCRAVIRTGAASPEAAEAAGANLTERAAAVGVQLQRLDSEHALGYLATLPLGGGPL